jgi:hypothetical protein
MITLAEIGSQLKQKLNVDLRVIDATLHLFRRMLIAHSAYQPGTERVSISEDCASFLIIPKKSRALVDTQLLTAQRPRFVHPDRNLSASPGPVPNAIGVPSECASDVSPRN